MVKNRMPLGDIFREAAKCDIVCTDCHIKIHQQWMEAGIWPPRKARTQNETPENDTPAKPRYVPLEEFRKVWAKQSGDQDKIFADNTAA